MANNQDVLMCAVCYTNLKKYLVFVGTENSFLVLCLLVFRDSFSSTCTLSLYSSWKPSLCFLL